MWQPGAAYAAQQKGHTPWLELTRQASTRSAQGQLRLPAGLAHAHKPTRDSNNTAGGSHEAEAFASDNGSELDLAGLPRSTLVELLKDPATAGYVRVRAAEALARMQPDDEASRDWRTSVQDRADYRRPMWDAVLDVARAAGAVVRGDGRGA
jgi:hypothetical protein